MKVKYGRTALAASRSFTRYVEVEFDVPKDWLYEDVYDAAKAWVNQKLGYRIPLGHQQLLVDYLKETGDL